jgi:hypothetical protein
MTIALALLLIVMTPSLVWQARSLRRMWSRGFMALEGTPVRREDHDPRFWRGFLLSAVALMIQAAVMVYLAGWVVAPRLLHRG